MTKAKITVTFETEWELTPDWDGETPQERIELIHKYAEDDPGGFIEFTYELPFKLTIEEIK